MRRIVLVALAALLLLIGGALAYEMTEADGGFTLMAETESRALLLNEKTLQARLVDKVSGQALDTCVMNGQQGNKTIKNTQKSAVILNYFSNAQNGTTAAIDSYSKSVQLETFTLERLPMGFAVHYEIGDDTFIIDDLPKAIRADKYLRLQEGAGWTSKQQKTFNDNYRAVKLSGLEHEYMIRVKDDSLSVLLIKQLHGLIFDSGLYTKDDMMADNADVLYERVYLPKLSLTLRYELEGDDLLVTVPAGDIAFTPENEVTSLELLPYFLSADTGKEGYIFVPDGTGALIYLNNQKLAATSYIGRVYGKDALINLSAYSPPRDDITLPVFGIKQGDSAVLAIIEKGAEIASIYADVSGRGDEFNRVSPRFLIREVESVALAGNDSITSPRFASDVYQGDIVMRYQLLRGDQADYTGMAAAYRRYLISRGTLTEKPADPDAPFFLELLGAVQKEKFILGVPYLSSVQATTLPQGLKIYQAVREAGARNIQLIYSGLFYGGVKHAALTLPSLDGGMGGAGALKNLKNAVEANGDTLYPGVYLGRVFGTRGFSPLSQAPRKHDGEPAMVPVFGEPILKLSNMAGYYVSPLYLKQYISKAISALDSYDFEALDVYDLGGSLIGDFKRRENLSRINAMPVYTQAFETLSENYRLMLDAPMLYALPYAAFVTGLPSGDNGYRVTDAAVPFIQQVLDGCVAYSGDSWNLKAYLGLEDQLLYALESKSSPRFTFTYEMPTVFHNTADMDYLAYFSTQYEQWMESVNSVYAQYNAFYQLVRDARVVKHEILSDTVRAATYDNGVKVLLNYGDNPAAAGNVTVPGHGYVISEGVRP